LDHKTFPSKGLFFHGNFQVYPFSSIPSSQFQEFAVAKLKIQKVIKLNNKINAEVLGEGGLRLGNSEGINVMDFFLGGFGAKSIDNQIPFLGYDFLDISGDSYIKSSFKLNYNFYNKHHFNINANFANVGNNILSINEWVNLTGYSGYGIGYGLESFLGPIQAMYSFSTDPNTKDHFFVSLGYNF